MWGTMVVKRLVPKRTRRRRPKRLGTKAEQLLAVRPALNALAWRMRSDMKNLRRWEQEDLVQEILLKAVSKLDRFDGRSSLKTWVIVVAKRHLIQMARAAAIRPRPLDDGVLDPAQHEHCPIRQEELRETTGELLEWLDWNPDEVDHGWEVLNLLLWNHGDYSYVALSMSLHTGESWTVSRVHSVVRKIKETEMGLELLETLRLTNGAKE